MIDKLNKEIIIILGLITFFMGLVFASDIDSKITDNYAFLKIDSTINNTIHSNMVNYVNKYEYEIKRAKRIESLLKLLTRVKSPVATEHYASLIYDLSDKSGVDYRVIVAIMGTESGYCKKPIYYNCFGYLNKVKYESYDAAFNHLIPKISNQYVKKYGWDFDAFTKAYGQLGEHASENMYGIAIQLYY